MTKDERIRDLTIENKRLKLEIEYLRRELGKSNRKLDDYSWEINPDRMGS